MKYLCCHFSRSYDDDVMCIEECERKCATVLKILCINVPFTNVTQTFEYWIGVTREHTRNHTPSRNPDGKCQIDKCLQFVNIRTRFVLYTVCDKSCVTNRKLWSLVYWIFHPLNEYDRSIDSVEQKVKNYIQNHIW